MVNQKNINNFKPLKMKKLVLSAIVMIAFSGISNANTVALEEDINCTEFASVVLEVTEELYHNETGNCFDGWIYNYLYETEKAQCEMNQSSWQ